MNAPSPAARLRFAASLLAFLIASLPASLSAQAPDAAPPWWNYSREDATVSLFWDFNNAANPLLPTSQTLPTWYSPPPGPSMFALSTNVAWQASVGGQPGVLALSGPGLGTIDVLIDNSPDPLRTKTMTVQFDSFGQGGSEVLLEIAKDLSKYERKILAEQTTPLAGGWVRTELKLLLVPQPASEELKFALNALAAGPVAIDNLFVSTHCQEYDGDKAGGALGKTDAAALNVDLSGVTGGAVCTAAAATEGPQGAVTYWIAGRSAVGDQIFAVDGGGTPVAAPLPLPSAVPSVEGASDLAVAEFPLASGSVQQVVFALLDRRPSNGTTAIIAIDASAAQPILLPGLSVTTTAALGPGPLGLAYSPYGGGSLGSFWISDQNGNVTEIDQAGVALRTLTPQANGTPTGISGAAFDRMTGLFYWFSQTPTPTAAGPSRINGYVHDGYSLQPQSVRWLGDRSFASPLGPGGVARGLELFRSGGRARLLCVQDLGGASRLHVIEAPFAFGLGMKGRMAMRGGLPAFGNANFALALEGCPRALVAQLYMGFSNTSTGGISLPLDLLPLGLDESDLCIDPSMSFPAQLVTNGSAVQPLPLPPPSPLFSNVDAWFQWIVLDPTVTAGVATSQAGGTRLY